MEKVTSSKRGRAVSPLSRLVLQLLVVFVLGRTSPAAEPAVRWNWRLPLPTGNNLHGVAYGAGQFVAVGDFGTLLTSTNGTQWVAREGVEEVSLNAVVFANGKFLAMGAGGAVFQSADGIQWNRTASLAGFNLSAVVYAQGQYVMTGDRPSGEGGAFFTSTSGENWVTHPVSPGFHPWGLAFGNGGFVAFGFSQITGANAGFRSTDGQNWNSLPNVPTEMMAGLAFGNGKFVLGSLSGGTWTSDDGVEWDPTMEPGVGRFRGLSFVEGRFLAPLNEEPTLLSSTDGVNWTSESSNAQRPLIAFAAVGARTVGVGYNGQICLSTEAGSWAGQTQYSLDQWLPAAPGKDGIEGPLLDTESMLTSVAFGRDRFIAVGLQFTVRSVPGGAWIVGDRGALPPLVDIASDGQRFAAVGFDGTVAVTTDGVDWSTSTIESGMVLRSITYNNGRWLAVGRRMFPDQTRLVFASSDLQRWKVIYTSTNPLLNAQAGGGQIVITAESKSGKSSVVTSSDGVNWTETAFPRYLGKLNYDPAYGFRSVNTRSTEGKWWEFRSPLAPRFLEDVATAGYIMAAVSSSELGVGDQDDASITIGGYGSWDIQLSRWPAPWEPSLRLNPALYDIAYGADTFVAVGAGCILQSDRLSTAAPIRLKAAQEDANSVRLTAEFVPGAKVTVGRASALGGWSPLRTFSGSTGLETWLEPTNAQEPRQFFRATAATP